MRRFAGLSPTFASLFAVALAPSLVNCGAKPAKDVAAAEHKARAKTANPPDPAAESVKGASLVAAKQEDPSAAQQSQIDAAIRASQAVQNDIAVAVRADLARYERKRQNDAQWWNSARREAASMATTVAYPSTKAALAALSGAAFRQDEDQAFDRVRPPSSFFDYLKFKPDSHVIEVGGKDSWFMTLAAPMVAARGHLRVVTGNPKGNLLSPFYSQAQRVTQTLATAPELYAKVEHHPILSVAKIDFGPESTADLVVAIHEVQDWVLRKRGDDFFAASARALKDGGLLAVVGTEASEDEDPKAAAQAGKVGAKWLVDHAERHGFRSDGNTKLGSKSTETVWRFRKDAWAKAPGEQ
jgi:predicted methyltransferase